MGCLRQRLPQGLLCAQRQGEPGLCVAYCADTDCQTGAPAAICRPAAASSSAGNQVCHDDGRCGTGCTSDGMR